MDRPICIRVAFIKKYFPEQTSQGSFGMIKASLAKIPYDNENTGQKKLYSAARENANSGECLKGKSFFLSSENYIMCRIY